MPIQFITRNSLVDLTIFLMSSGHCQHDGISPLEKLSNSGECLWHSRRKQETASCKVLLQAVLMHVHSQLPCAIDITHNSMNLPGNCWTHSLNSPSSCSRLPATPTRAVAQPLALRFSTRWETILRAEETFTGSDL